MFFPHCSSHIRDFRHIFVGFITYTYNFVVLFDDDAVMCIYFSTRLNSITLRYFVGFKNNAVHFRLQIAARYCCDFLACAGKRVTSLKQRQSSCWCLPVE